MDTSLFSQRRKPGFQRIYQRLPSPGVVGLYCFQCQSWDLRILYRSGNAAGPLLKRIPCRILPADIRLWPRNSSTPTERRISGHHARGPSSTAYQRSPRAHEAVDVLQVGITELFELGGSMATFHR